MSAGNVTSPDDVKDLNDYQDVQIFTTIYMGPDSQGDMQSFEMIPDTGSNWLWVNSRVCSNCPKKLPSFDERTSENF